MPEQTVRSASSSPTIIRSSGTGFDGCSPSSRISRSSGRPRTAARLSSACRRCSPTCCCWIWRCPGPRGLETLRELARGEEQVRSVMLTASIDREDALEAVRLGARGVVLKTAATPLLYKCIRAVVAGEYWIGHERVQDLVESLRALPPRAVGRAPAGRHPDAPGAPGGAGGAGGRLEQGDRPETRGGRADSEEPPLGHLRQARGVEPPRTGAVRRPSPARWRRPSPVWTSDPVLSSCSIHYFGQLRRARDLPQSSGEPPDSSVRRGSGTGCAVGNR